MTPNTIMICQPFGIGDILFVQKICHHFADRGFKVVMPIANPMSWLLHYIKPHANVEYPIMYMADGTTYASFRNFQTFLELSTAAGPHGDVSTGLFKTPIVYNGGDEESSFIFLAIGSSYVWTNDKVMPAKYNFVNLDFSDWVDYVHLKRRPHVEAELFYEVLGVKDGDRYTLINEDCSSHSIRVDVPGPVVRMRRQDCFTFLDWGMVIEKATQIVTIDTSLVLYTEILKPQIPLYMVSRYDPPSFEHVEDILSLDWKLVLTPEELSVPSADELKINAA